MQQDGVKTHLVNQEMRCKTIFGNTNFTFTFAEN